ncbi:molybdenum cofactor guanylyltransferase [Motilimonas sp. KMU-193]|uniref:molybdenum cofactor guanylyltransferase n=1 Tax=Motilimonas sp. KMU-193 TaxID=3388668 RepID=UPI00396AF04B
MRWENHEISAVILAGGKSSRMGQDKAMLPREGQTQLAYCFNLLAQMQFGELKVSGDYPDFPHFVDAEPELGPLGGLSAALQQVAPYCKALLIVPVDMPLLSSFDIRFLLEGSNEQGGYYQDALFPVLLGITPQLRSELKDLLADPSPHKRSLRSLLKRLNVQVIEPDIDQQLSLMNANTPEQWQTLLAKQ